MNRQIEIQLIPKGTSWADVCDADDEFERSKVECEPVSAVTAAMNVASTYMVSKDAPNFWTEVSEEECALDCYVQELKGKQVVCIGPHTYQLGSLTNDKKRSLTTDELRHGWTIKAIEVCPESAILAEEEAAKVYDFQGPGAMRVKAASEAFKCKLSLRGFGAEGKMENGVFVPQEDTARPVVLIAAKNDKQENLRRAIQWASARVHQIHEGIADEFEAKIHNARAAVEASRRESDDSSEAIKEAKKAQTRLQKDYEKHLKAWGHC